MSTLKDVAQLSPKEAAKRLAELQLDADWLSHFTEHLDALRTGHSLARTLDVWDLSQSEAARLFGVSRQALNKWLANGTPSERVDLVADLAAMTDLFVHYLKRDRIPAVVRRPVAVLGNKNLLELIAHGESAAALQTTRDMFDFHSAQIS